MIRTSPHDLAHIELQLEQSRQASRPRLLVFLFWGLILAKCCVLQWAIIRYEMPIDAGLYIWTPSIIFGALCTWFYGRIFLKELRRSPIFNRLVRGIWAACCVLFLLFGLVGVTFGSYSPLLLPAVGATVIGLGYYLHSLLGHSGLFKSMAIGWWAGAFWLFAHPTVDGLAWFAVFCIAFQVLPTALLYREQKPPAATPSGR